MGRLAHAVPSEQSSPIVAEANKLFDVAMSSLPAKFRAEHVFHRREDGGLAPEDVLAWCQLLSQRSLLTGAGICTDVADETWKQLVHEASQVIAVGGPDHIAAALLKVFSIEGDRRKWSASLAETPLGTVASAVSKEWHRAVTDDGELEDPMHEPEPIPPTIEKDLCELFSKLDL